MPTFPITLPQSISDTVPQSIADTLQQSIADNLPHSITNTLPQSIADNLPHSITNNLPHSNANHVEGICSIGCFAPDFNAYSFAQFDRDSYFEGISWICEVK
jgi:hypothetical protein